MSIETDWWFDSNDPEVLQRERNKSKLLKQTQWWKNRRGCGKCYYCEKMVSPKLLTMDHVVPLIRGGKSTKSNLVPCCNECNQQKSNLIPSEWNEYLQKLASSRSSE